MQNPLKSVVEPFHPACETTTMILADERRKRRINEWLRAVLYTIILPVIN